MRKTKICSKCNKELPTTLKYFHKEKKGKYGLRSICKECRKKEYIDNIEDRKKYRKKQYEKNRSKYIEEAIKWRKENKIRVNERRKERRKKNPHLRIKSTMSKNIWRSLKKMGTSKRGYTWERIVDYTVKDLMNHLEEQFQEGMTWDNYGEWHIDHICPQSIFYFTSYEDEEFKKCWSLENLQPLWAIDNLKKGDKII